MEILSPASNKEHITVAIDNNANAVYGGLKKWNARNKAINFSAEEYNEIIDELHQHNIKFFLTLNILMLDKEIDEVIDFLRNNKLPDAFIVTDIGLISELHKEFPNVPLHFSTQFGAHNIDDVSFIESLHGERAILSRELTLKEINKIKEKSNIELECFVWGSQCLSFSGLCFFGTLINGGGGNRGKCIITCRDIYSVNNEKGHYLYVPDMDCINLKSKLNGIDCLKIEGRRRPPKEIANVLRQINKKIPSINNSGYMYGTNVEENNLFEKINTRTKPVMAASLLEDINENDICIKYDNSKPIGFSNDYNNPNAMYIYTELKKGYDINKKNICIDLKIDKNNVLKEVLYLNYKGEGHTFFCKNNELIIFDLNQFVLEIEQANSKINVYKMKYQRQNNKDLLVDKKTYDEMKRYIINDCIEKNHKLYNNKLKLNYIYMETNDLNVIDEFKNEEFVKIIYDIASINNLKKISEVIKKYDNYEIIYKLPLFNWKSEDLSQYLEILKDHEVMFTRLTQINICKNITFKRRYVDYTIYTWNKKTLKFLKDNKIDVFTASPELSYETNKLIFGNEKMQVILCGKIPLVYTRNCFSHLFECNNCKNNQSNCKNIKNEDKKLNFEIYCNDDFRYILNKEPILNNYSKVKITDNTTFRYVTLGQDIDSIKETINCLKNSNNYYASLLKLSYWKKSYECNLLEGKE